MCKICDRDDSYTEVENAQSIYDCLSIGYLNKPQVNHLKKHGTAEAKKDIKDLEEFISLGNESGAKQINQRNKL